MVSEVLRVDSILNHLHQFPQGALLQFGTSTCFHELSAAILATWNVLEILKIVVRSVVVLSIFLFVLISVVEEVVEELLHFFEQVHIDPIHQKVNSVPNVLTCHIHSNLFVPNIVIFFYFFYKKLARNLVLLRSHFLLINDNLSVFSLVEMSDIVFDVLHNFRPGLIFDVEEESFLDSVLDGALSRGHEVLPQAHECPVKALVR
mmetsp:Transcript_20597/g.19567  ORF Transcript_20597/g.19567 Transcript_20597/m.19567 type:complete len:204 (+) Transcript_20597:1556-2167(+)